MRYRPIQQYRLIIVEERLAQAVRSLRLRQMHRQHPVMQKIYAPRPNAPSEGGVSRNPESAFLATMESRDLLQVQDQAPRMNSMGRFCERPQLLCIRKREGVSIEDLVNWFYVELMHEPTRPAAPFRINR